MATKKNDNKSNGKPATSATPAADPLADLRKKIAAYPKRAQELILKAGSGTKLVKSEVGELRTFKLKTNGDPIAKHTGPRNKAMINAQAIANVVGVAGVEGLIKLNAKYGSTLKKPLAAFLKNLPEGDDKNALETLAKTWYPRAKGPGGFTARDHQVVGKTARVAFAVNEFANVGDQLKREIVTLPDGRVGLFVFVSAKASAAPVEAAPALPPAAPTVAPFMSAPSA